MGQVDILEKRGDTLTYDVEGQKLRFRPKGSVAQLKDAYTMVESFLYDPQGHPFAKIPKGWKFGALETSGETAWVCLDQPTCKITGHLERAALGPMVYRSNLQVSDNPKSIRSIDFWSQPHKLTLYGAAKKPLLEGSNRHRHGEIRFARTGGSDAEHDVVGADGLDVALLRHALGGHDAAARRGENDVVEQRAKSHLGVRLKRSRGAGHLDLGELAMLKRVDQLVQDALDELDVSVWAVHVDGRAAKAHRHPQLCFEHAKVRAARSGELQE